MDASQVTYGAVDLSDWVGDPTEVSAALDELASRAPSALTAWSDNAVLRGDGTTGIQGSSVTIDDSGHLAVAALDRIYVDGGGDTFLVESAGNELDIVTGGTIHAVFDGSGSPQVLDLNGTANLNGAVNVSGVLDVNGQSGLTFDSTPATCKVLAPIGLHAANTTSVTALVTREVHFLYVGRLLYPITSAKLQCEVTTAYVAGNFAAVGLYSGVPVAGTSLTLSLLGQTDVSATFNSTGIKSVTITPSSTVVAGTDLWVAYGQRGGTQYQLRALLPDVMQQGVVQAVLTTLLATNLAASYATSLAGTTIAPAWCSLWV
jgi:hypothetical protein